MEVIKIWPSLMDALEFLKGRRKNCSHISSCAMGKQETAYGFKWAYVTE
jgi:hypothetical protein